MDNEIDDDLYGDLDQVSNEKDDQRVSDLKEKLNAVSEELRNKILENKKLIKEKKLYEKNFYCLLNTVRREIQRKDALIEELKKSSKNFSIGSRQGSEDKTENFRSRPPDEMKASEDSIQSRLLNPVEREKSSAETKRETEMRERRHKSRDSDSEKFRDIERRRRRYEGQFRDERYRRRTRLSSPDYRSGRHRRRSSPDRHFSHRSRSRSPFKNSHRPYHSSNRSRGNIKEPRNIKKSTPPSHSSSSVKSGVPREEKRTASKHECELYIEQQKNQGQSQKTDDKENCLKEECQSKISVKETESEREEGEFSSSSDHGIFEDAQNEPDTEQFSYRQEVPAVKTIFSIRMEQRLKRLSDNKNEPVTPLVNGFADDESARDKQENAESYTDVVNQGNGHETQRPAEEISYTISESRTESKQKKAELEETKGTEQGAIFLVEKPKKPLSLQDLFSSVSQGQERSNECNAQLSENLDSVCSNEKSTCQKPPTVFDFSQYKIPKKTVKNDDKNFVTSGLENYHTGEKVNSKQDNDTFRRKSPRNESRKRTFSGSSKRNEKTEKDEKPPKKNKDLEGNAKADESKKNSKKSENPSKRLNSNLEPKKPSENIQHHKIRPDLPNTKDDLNKSKSHKAKPLKKSRTSSGSKDEASIEEERLEKKIEKPKVRSKNSKPDDSKSSPEMLHPRKKHQRLKNETSQVPFLVTNHNTPVEEKAQNENPEQEREVSSIPDHESMCIRLFGPDSSPYGQDSASALSNSGSIENYEIFRSLTTPNTPEKPKSSAQRQIETDLCLTESEEESSNSEFSDSDASAIFNKFF